GGYVVVVAGEAGGGAGARDGGRDQRGQRGHPVAQGSGGHGRAVQGQGDRAAYGGTGEPGIGGGEPEVGRLRQRPGPVPGAEGAAHRFVLLGRYLGGQVQITGAGTVVLGGRVLHPQVEPCLGRCRGGVPVEADQGRALAGTPRPG